MRVICTKKIGAISLLGAEKITFPPKNIQTDRRTFVVRVASLLKMLRQIFNMTCFFEGIKQYIFLIAANKQGNYTISKLPDIPIYSVSH